MTAFREEQGVTIAYDYADVTIVARGPYGQREMPFRIPFESKDVTLIALLLARRGEVEQRRIADSGGGANASIIG